MLDIDKQKNNLRNHEGTKDQASHCSCSKLRRFYSVSGSDECFINSSVCYLLV